MGNVAVGAGALVGVGAASDSQAKTAIPVATIAVNNIRTLKRLIETPRKIEMCARPAHLGQRVSIRSSDRDPMNEYSSPDRRFRFYNGTEMATPENPRTPGSAEGSPSLPTGLDAAGAVAMYRTMVLSRLLDERVWLLNRQGKVGIAASAQGHEAAQVATVEALDPSRDHFLIYYRQFTAMLALGTTPLELLCGFLAKAGEPLSGARQFPLHGSHPRVDLFSFSNVVGTQMSQAVGVALADRLRGEDDRVTVAFFGDGGASQGDSHEAMNFAGIHKLPVLFLCENNGYAISVPLRLQMGIESEATRAAAYGFTGVSVDGTDIFAVYEATREAAASIRAGGGPVLLEVMVDRLLPHTSDDDHTRYRSPVDILEMQGRDPVELTSRTLKNMGLLSDDEDRKIHQDARRAVIDATDKAEALPYPGIENMYDHVYADARQGD